MGKLRNEELAEMLRCIRRTPRVIVPPLPGFDSGVHEIDSHRLLVISTDPCIGVPEKWFGWLLISYAASDVALFGAKPQYCSVNLLGPLGTERQTFQKALRQACTAADEHGLTIITGHTGSYRGLTTMVGVCTAYGIINKNELITPAGAKPGDLILCTKPIGLELAVNFALAQKKVAGGIFGKRRVYELRRLVKMQSCVNEAFLLARTGFVHAMHDATEGGLTAAINEMAEASQLGFTVEFEKIPFARESEMLSDHFRLSDTQLLSMSSTGAVLAAVDPKSLGPVDKTLRRIGISPAVIGVFSEDRKRRILKHGKRRQFPKAGQDPYERILSGRV
jgi:hydrogenase maturation factor